MKKSGKIIRSLMIVMIFGLITINAQAQTINVSHSTTTVINYGKTGAKVISKYQEGAAIIQHLGKFGLVNQEGYEICKPQYEEVRLFNHGYAAVKKNGKWTFVNKQGNKLTNFRYDWVGSFAQGYAAVRENGKWGLLNEQGFEVVPTIYKKVKVAQDGTIWIISKKTWKTFKSNKNVVKPTTIAAL